ncbi:MAG: hypothetical protein LUE64_06100 [Candidatus Gastranaerophilales bacterium]|nr:hypothetical protein [Candidatus Gastranaerophilales bacterium]
MTAYKYLINGAEVKNIISPEWSDDLKNYANTFSFSTDSTYEIGSMFQIITEDGEIVLKGIITDFEQNELNIFQYSGFDCGFYINQNEIIEQFKKIKISDAITKLCQNYEIPVGTIPEMTSTVTEIFKDKTLSEVFNQLIEYAKSKGCIKDIYSTCAKGKFEILSYETIEDLTGYVGIFSMQSQKTISSPSIKVSMQDLKNRVIIADSSDKKLTRITVSDSESISKYGLLQDVETLDTTKANNLSKIASNKLTELNKLSKSISMTMLGDYRMHKGVIMPIECDEFGFKGNFLITSSKHTIDGQKELVSVAVEMYEE